MSAATAGAANEPLSPTRVQELASWIAGLSPAGLDPEVAEYAKVLVLDTLGCALGALHAEPVRAVRHVIDEAGGNGMATRIGGGTTALDRAALWNGCLVRYLDFMDFYLASGQTFHPSDNLAAILAACEHAGRSGRDLILTLALAYQIQARLSEVAPLQEKGFDHCTHLAYSVAAGVGWALELDERRLANALALCGNSQLTLWAVRTGLLSQWKGLASAQAAASAVLMTQLAQAGITGPMNVFERGFEEFVANPVGIDWKHEKLDRLPRTCIKRFNAEAHSQSCLEAVVELRERERIRPEQVQAVEVDIFKQAVNIIGGGEAGDRTIVRSKEQADHSLYYLCAVALLDGDVQPEQLEAERVLRDDVQGLLRRVWVRRSDPYTETYPQEMRCRVSILMADGCRHQLEKTDYEGFHAARRLTFEQAAAKFERLAAASCEPGLRRELIEAVRSLDTIPVRDLTALLALAR